MSAMGVRRPSARELAPKQFAIKKGEAGLAEIGFIFDLDRTHFASRVKLLSPETRHGEDVAARLLPDTEEQPSVIR
jgi:hypothetical protein